jgi:colicin import membrane protein
MSSIKKFAFSFILAVMFHGILLALFGVDFNLDSELVKAKPVPEIIQASMLDEEIVMEEAQRLKTNEKNRKLAEKKRQQELETNRKKEQELWETAKKQRADEEQKTKEVTKRREELEVKEKQRQQEIKQKKVEEAARLAKIKLEKEVEEKRQKELKKEDEKRKELARKEKEKKQAELQKAKEKKQKAERLAKKKRKAQALAKRKAQAAKDAVEEQQRVADFEAKQEQDRKATISITASIQRKVDSKWVRPLSSKKGLNCVISVKLLPSGDVMDVRVVRGSGDNVFDRAAENAVRKASPLPVPNDRTLFRRQFRSFSFKFNPN